MEPVETIKAGNTLGECILWDGETQSVWWTDIEERLLYRFDWRRRELRKFSTPERLCSFGFVEGCRSLIAAFESGFALYDPHDGSIVWLARPESLRPGFRLNDGRVDRQGRLWVGGLAETEAGAGKAHLYCFDGSVRLCESGVTILNGICWSPDGAWFYLADSAWNTIWRYAFSAVQGTISGRSIFATTPDRGSPDGSAVDAEGFVWNARWGAGCVVRYAPDGRIDRVLEVPVSHPTCVAFGGPQLDLLFVTSARQGLGGEALSRQSGAGDVLVYNVNVTGLPEHRFRRDGVAGI